MQWWSKEEEEKGAPSQTNKWNSILHSGSRRQIKHQESEKPNRNAAIKMFVLHLEQQEMSNVLSEVGARVSLAGWQRCVCIGTVVASQEVKRNFQIWRHSALFCLSERNRRRTNFRTWNLTKILLENLLTFRITLEFSTAEVTHYNDATV